MANQVFANGREIACKAAKGKTICAFPDVCFTPPQTPATPPGVPIPYPNTGMAKDTSNGSKNVKISKKEVVLKNTSFFKTSTGDEAGMAPKKGVITSSNKGKVYFKSWSMDVKVEGKNVTRHLDLTTNNHASEPGDTPPWPYQDGMVLGSQSPMCEKAQQAMVNEADNLPDSMSRIHEDAVTRREKSRAEAYRGRKPSAVTIGVGMVIGGSSGAPSVTPAHSRKIVGEAASREHYAKGIDSPNKSKAKGCGTGKPFQYRKGQLDHRHAEAKLIEDWAASGSKGQLILNISRPVCEHCANLIRHVNCGPDGKQCNKIIVCDNNQNDEARARLEC
jgi:hypothetical protein